MHCRYLYGILKFRNRILLKEKRSKSNHAHNERRILFYLDDEKKNGEI